MMKSCKYCGSLMTGEHETNPRNSHRYKEFYVCRECKAVCDGEYIDKKDGIETISERWWNPNTKQFEK